ncbi:MAG: hypothetical protein ACI9EF_002966 [Pseudohongiellaceae bacterium]|jgi:hypothetical protein
MAVYFNNGSEVPKSLSDPLFGDFGGCFWGAEGGSVRTKVGELSFAEAGFSGS